MSIKEEIQHVKEELSTEEQFFEQAVKVERFYKRYKAQLIAGGVLIVAGVIAYAASEAMERGRVEAVNAAYVLLQKEPDNAEAAAVLNEKSPALYDARQLSQALQSSDLATLNALQYSTVPEVADVAAYQAASLETESNSSIKAYASRPDALLGDLARIDEAVTLFKTGKIKEAHQRLRMISEESEFHTLAQSLMHYGVQ